MALGELFAGLSRAAESTRRRIQDLLGRSRNPLRLVVERATDAPGKGVAAKSRNSADVKEDVVVKRRGLSSERGKG